MRGAIAAVAVLALAITGCGVATDGGAQTAEPEEVPFGLLDEERDPVTGPEPGRGTVAELYLYDDEEERLVATRTRIERSSLTEVLSALLEGPEEGRDLRSAIAGAEIALEAEMSGGVAMVNLSEEFTDLSGSNQRIAIAQLVFTSTGRPGVGQVTFALEGDPIEIPRGDGSITTGSVTRGDYSALAPE